MTGFSLFLLEMFTKFGAKGKNKQIYHPTVEGKKYHHSGNSVLQVFVILNIKG